MISRHGKEHLKHVTSKLQEIAPSLAKRLQPNRRDESPVVPEATQRRWGYEGLQQMASRLSDYAHRSQEADSSFFTNVLLAPVEHMPQEGSPTPKKEILPQKTLLEIQLDKELTIAFDTESLYISHTHQTDETHSSVFLFRENQHEQIEITTNTPHGGQNYEYVFFLDPRMPLEKERYPERRVTVEEILRTAYEIHQEVMTTATTRELSEEEMERLSTSSFPDFLLTDREPPQKTDILPIPPTPESKDPIKSESLEESHDITLELAALATKAYRIGSLSEDNIPYNFSDPQLAHYIAENSLVLYSSDEVPLGLVSAQPEKNILFVHLFPQDPASKATTLSFHKTPSTDEATIQIAKKPFGYPYAKNENTTYYPVTEAITQAAEKVGQTIWLRLLTDNIYAKMLSLESIEGTLYQGIELHRFVDFAASVLQAALPDKNSLQIRTVFLDKRLSGGRNTSRESEEPQYVLSIHRKGNDKSLTIWNNESDQTITFRFEKSQDDTQQQKQIILRLDSDGMHVLQDNIQQNRSGIESIPAYDWRITPELIASDPRWSSVLQEIKEYIHDLGDAWTIAQTEYPESITLSAQQELPSVMRYLSRLLQNNGELHVPYFPSVFPTKRGGQHERQSLLPSPNLNSTPFSAHQLIDKAQLPKWLTEQPQVKEHEVAETDLSKANSEIFVIYEDPGTTTSEQETYTQENSTFNVVLIGEPVLTPQPLKRRRRLGKTSSTAGIQESAKRKSKLPVKKGNETRRAIQKRSPRSGRQTKRKTI